MPTTFSAWDDTIVALATPPGIGALGVIRLSGPDAISIVDALFPSKNLQAQRSHTAHVGLLQAGTDVLDEVVVTLYKTPRSYTGENVAEISCHGSPFIHEKILSACMHVGARLAKPGEFTQRAFLAGKLDLTQAEAVADLIASNTTATHHAALHNIRGGFSQVLKVLRDQLIQFSALIELELDFSQEDVEFADRTRLYALVQSIKTQTTTLIQSFQLGNVVKNGVSVAIVGKPNAGKSTLLNMLLNEERAIVSDIPGTTRDTIEEVLNIDGILFRLIDTAGIRHHTSDRIEAEGIKKSRAKMQESNLVLYLFDSAETDPNELAGIVMELEAAAPHYLLVGNKIDVQNQAAVQQEYGVFKKLIFISAQQGLHVESLKQQMLDAVLGGRLHTENTVVTNARHYHALLNIDSALNDVLQGLENQIPGDLLALDIRRSLHFLGEITGEVTNDDQLDYIFSKFCIGK